MIVYIQNCNLSQIPLVISTGDSWLNPAKYFEACHRIIMTNIFLAKQVPPWAWLGWCLVTRQERAGLATVKLRARDQAPHLPSLYTPELSLSPVLPVLVPAGGTVRLVPVASSWSGAIIKY